MSTEIVALSFHLASNIIDAPVSEEEATTQAEKVLDLCLSILEANISEERSIDTPAIQGQVATVADS